MNLLPASSMVNQTESPPETLTNRLYLSFPLLKPESYSAAWCDSILRRTRTESAMPLTRKPLSNPSTMHVATAIDLATSSPVKHEMRAQWIVRNRWHILAYQELPRSTKPGIAKTLPFQCKADLLISNRAGPARVLLHLGLYPLSNLTWQRSLSAIPERAPCDLLDQSDQNRLARLRQDQHLAHCLSDPSSLTPTKCCLSLDLATQFRADHTKPTSQRQRMTVLKIHSTGSKS